MSTSSATALSGSSRKRRCGWGELLVVAAACLLVAQLLPDIITAWFHRPRAGHQTPSSVELRDANNYCWRMQYWVYLPRQYSSEQYWPLLIFLHGSGQRGDDLDLVRKRGLPAMIAEGKQFPMVVVSPQCRLDSSWDSQQLLALLDHLEQRFSVDVDRVYISGESMGGNGTWDLACTAPGRFAAAVPVCGGGDVDQADRLAHLPIWAFHGAKDEVVPVDFSEAMVEAINAHGGNARLTILENQGHGICDIVFSRNDVYDWLLAQRRSKDR